MIAVAFASSNILKLQNETWLLEGWFSLQQDQQSVDSHLVKQSSSVCYWSAQTYKSIYDGSYRNTAHFQVR